jgi:isopenicillin N synthase-like dioxygenase
MNGIVDNSDVALYEAYDNRYVRCEQRFGVERRAIEKVPCIDLSPFVREGALADRRAVAAQIREACIDIGFFYLTGHDIPAAEIDEVVTQGKRFFTQSLDEKMKVHASKSPTNRGFMQTGGLNPGASANKTPDIKERYLMSREPLPGEDDIGYSVGKSQWPDASAAPGFEDFMKRHMRNRVMLLQRLVRAFALSLDLPEDYFDATHARPGGVLALNFYPHIEGAQLARTQWSFSPHTDYGGITLLTQDDVGGLQARNAAGDWIDIPPREGAFVINIGDLFAMWTNDLYASNLHRAMNMSGASRLSAAFFTSPNGSTIIGCLPTCEGPANPPRYAPVRAADYNTALIKQAHSTGRPGISTETAKRLKGS